MHWISPCPSLLITQFSDHLPNAVDSCFAKKAKAYGHYNNFPASTLTHRQTKQTHYQFPFGTNKQTNISETDKFDFVSKGYQNRSQTEKLNDEEQNYAIIQYVLGEKIKRLLISP